MANTLHDAIVAVESGETARAVPLLEKVIATDPQIPVAQLQLGVARARERRFADAVARAAQGHQAAARLGAGALRDGHRPVRDGRREDGGRPLGSWSRDAEVGGRTFLVRLRARAHRARPGSGHASCSAALALSPGHYRANLLLGRILILQGKAAEGLPHLQRAAEAQPSSGEAQAFLADAYQSLGRTAEAEQARARARALRAPAPPPDVRCITRRAPGG